MVSRLCTDCIEIRAAAFYLLHSRSSHVLIAGNEWVHREVALATSREKGNELFVLLHSGPVRNNVLL